MVQTVGRADAKALWSECACLKNSEDTNVAQWRGGVIGEAAREINKEEAGGGRHVEPCKPCKEFSFTPCECRSD